jgi:hypothetical protein
MFLASPTLLAQARTSMLSAVRTSTFPMTYTSTLSPAHTMRLAGTTLPASSAPPTSSSEVYTLEVTNLVADEE